MRVGGLLCKAPNRRGRREVWRDFLHRPPASDTQNSPVIVPRGKGRGTSLLAAWPLHRLLCGGRREVCAAGLVGRVYKIHLCPPMANEALGTCGGPALSATLRRGVRDTSPTSGGGVARILAPEPCPQPSKHSSAWPTPDLRSRPSQGKWRRWYRCSRKYELPEAILRGAPIFELRARFVRPSVALHQSWPPSATLGARQAQVVVAARAPAVEQHRLLLDLDSLAMAARQREVIRAMPHGVACRHALAGGLLRKAPNIMCQGFWRKSESRHAALLRESAFNLFQKRIATHGVAKRTVRRGFVKRKPLLDESPTLAARLATRSIGEAQDMPGPPGDQS